MKKHAFSFLAVAALAALLSLVGCTSGASSTSSSASVDNRIPVKIETLVPQSGDKLVYYQRGSLELDGETFQIVDIQWTDSAGKLLTVDDTFRKGETYSAQLSVLNGGTTLMTDPSLYKMDLREGFSFGELGATDSSLSTLKLTVTCQDAKTKDHSHAFAEDKPVGLEQSCFKGGFVVKQCSECDARSYEDVAMYGAHKPAGVAVEVVKATCTTNGTSENTCLRCGQTYEETNEAFGHEWTRYGGGAPGCIYTGAKCYRCTRCDATYDEILPALGHDYQEVSHVGATCEDDGSTVYECSRCGDSYTETEAALGHDWERIGGGPADCTHDGAKCFRCARCNGTYDEVLPATGHNYEVVSQTDPQCTMPGNIGYRCKWCGDEYGTEIEAPGHSIVAIWYDAAEHVYQCSQCGWIDTGQGMDGHEPHTGSGGNCPVCQGN